MLAVVRGCCFLHAHRICHRDIKVGAGAGGCGGGRWWRVVGAGRMVRMQSFPSAQRGHRCMPGMPCPGTLARRARCRRSHDHGGLGMLGNLGMLLECQEAPVASCPSRTAITGIFLPTRALQSSNILLDQHGRAKLSDVGLAKIVGDKEAAAAVGTLAWAAPELLAGGGGECDEKADIFSLAVVLW